MVTTVFHFPYFLFGELPVYGNNNPTNFHKQPAQLAGKPRLEIPRHPIIYNKSPSLKKKKRDKGEKHAIFEKMPRNFAATRDTLLTVSFRRVMLSFLPKALDALRVVSTSKVLIGNTWICNRIISNVTSRHLFHCKSVFVTENGSLGLCCGPADFLIIGTGLTWNIHCSDCNLHQPVGSKVFTKLLRSIINFY